MGLRALITRVPFSRRIGWRIRRLLRPARFGTLRRTAPLSSMWGFDRGTPIDRYYINCFLSRHRADIHGRVLEILDSTYTEQFGRQVCRRDVLDLDPANPRATFVADLAHADSVPAASFDCFILTQTLQYIYDVHAAIVECHRILKPGGVLLATVPSIIRSGGRYQAIDYWRFTDASCRALFGEVFGPQNIELRSYGNVLSAIAFLSGIASQELSRRELDAHDERYPLTLAIRCIKQ